MKIIIIYLKSLIHSFISDNIFFSIINFNAYMQSTIVAEFINNKIGWYIYIHH